MHPPGESIIAFKAGVSMEDDAFTGSVTSYDEMSIWATERCIPLVREITFQVRMYSLLYGKWNVAMLEEFARNLVAMLDLYYSGVLVHSYQN